MFHLADPLTWTMGDPRDLKAKKGNQNASGGLIANGEKATRAKVCWNFCKDQISGKTIKDYFICNRTISCNPSANTTKRSDLDKLNVDEIQFVIHDILYSFENKIVFIGFSASSRFSLVRNA